MANTDALRAHAKAAYEMGRLRVALWHGIPVPVLGLLSLSESHQHVLTAIVAAIATASVVLFDYRGGALGAGARRGFLLGLVPFGASLASRGLGHAEAFGMCFHGCVAVCAAASVTMMLVLMQAARQRPEPVRYTVAGGWTMLAVAATACSCVGIAGVAALVVVVALVAFPVFAVSGRFAGAR
jgi:hypothetical protein